MNDIKQNNGGPELPEQMFSYQGLLSFLMSQSIWLYFIIVGLVLVAVAFIFYTIKINRDNEQASRLLSIAQTPKQFEELVRQYPKASTGPVALLALASSQFSAGDYVAASQSYSEFMEKYPQHPMLCAAELGKAMCSEAKGEIEKASMAFNAFLSAYPDHFLTPQALFGKARCLQATGKIAEARAIYENFIAAHPENKWRPNAESALQSLDRQMRLRDIASKKNGQQE